MSTEVHKGVIALDRSKDDLPFRLDERGAITNSNSKNLTSSFTKSKEISYQKADSMESKYSDGYDSYDDDFEDESPVRNSSRTTRVRQQSSRQSEYSYTPSPPTTRRQKKTNSRRNSIVSYRSTYASSRATNKPKKQKKTLSASERSPRVDDNSSMVKKILSANRNKITKLYNVVEELQQEVDNLRQENRTLKRISVKQEKELKRVDREEGSLPQLLQRHSAELHTYRQRLKKNKQDIQKKEKESHNHDVELTRLRDKLQHFKKLDNDKKLEERAALAKKLDRVEKSLAERDNKILELQKTIKLSEKARQREIKDHQDRYKKAKEDLVRVQENVLSLTEKLREKEKQLDMTNIYHQNVQRKLKKVNPLALPPTHQIQEQPETKINIETKKPEQKKVANVFLTNDMSDSSSNVTSQPAKSVRKGSLSDAMLELEKQKAEKLKDDFEREQRRKQQEEERREQERKEEQRRHELEDRRRREEQEAERLIEKAKKEKEEQEKLELERKEREERRKREEEEARLLKLKEEAQTQLKQKEDEEMRKKKDLLLARMRAIDAGKDSGIGDIDLNTKTQDDKPKKLPIFLQSSEKQQQLESSVTKDNTKQKFGSNSSIRSKNSKESYEVKESFQNLHHGLPAHPSNQHYRGRSNSGQDDDLFGFNKQSVGRHGNNKQDSIGSYNPSFNEPSKKTGLDFTKKQETKQNDVVFGSYQPSFSGSSRSSNAVAKDMVAKDSEGALDFSTKRNGRRGKPNQPTSVFGDDLFNDTSNAKQNSIFDDNSSRSKNKPSKNYPWETKGDDDSLLPRRQKINHVIDRSPKKQVPAVNSILNGALDDDLEEVTL